MHLLQCGHGRGELLQPRETEPGEPGERLVGVHAADRPLVGGEFLETKFNQLEQRVKGKNHELLIHLHSFPHEAVASLVG